MKQIARALVRIYPAAWRARYGSELGALLDDSVERWTDVPDILIEALRMRLASINWSLAAAFVLAGVAVATVVTFRTPVRYVSTAELRILSPGADFEKLTTDFSPATGGAFSRRTLTSLIQSPSLDLYRQERETRPLEDLIDRMRKDLKIDVTWPDHRYIKAAISYKGEDPGRAQKTVKAVMDHVIGEYVAQPDRLVRAPLVFQPATLPATPLRPRWMTVATGAICGLLTSLVFAGIRRRPGLALLAATGLGLGAAIVTAIPRPHVATATLVADSGPTRQRILSRSPVILAGHEKVGYQFSLEPDGSESGISLRVEGPDSARTSNMTLDIGMRLKKEANSGEWLVFVPGVIPASSLPRPDPLTGEPPFEFTWPLGIEAGALSVFLSASAILALDFRRRRADSRGATLFPQRPS